MTGFFQLHRASFSLLSETMKKRGFRKCQLGAVWATMSHFTASESHALINMPTGTGKTGIMMALAFELQARRVFVLAPTQLIRTQTASKFASLKLLKDIGALPVSLQEGPRVKELETRPKDPGDWQELLKYDVVVATPQTISPSFNITPPTKFFGLEPGEDISAEPPEFDLVFVDEAHHSPAKTWNAFLRLAKHNRVVCMTATPFRTDQRRIRAKLIYSYSIASAMKDEIYRPVDFVPIGDNNPERTNILLAERALELFNSERKTNPDAAIIIKAPTIAEAESLFDIYKKQGWVNLGIIHSQLDHRKNQDVIERVRGDSKGKKLKPQDRLSGFISVDMAGEGVDIPNLRIAVFHKAPKTLPYTVQLIGRVSRRQKGEPGNAFLVANPVDVKGAEVQKLYWSDKGWSDMLPGVFAERLAQSKFEPDAGSRLSQLPWLAADDFNPYLSVKVYQNGRSHVSRHFELREEECLVANDEVEFELFEQQDDTVFIVTKIWQVPGWTKNRAFEVENYDLHLFHITGPFLFECTSSEHICSKIRRFVFNESAYNPARYDVIRKALSDAQNGHYYMVGLRNQSGVINGIPEYKTYMGSDVQLALRTADARAFGAGHAAMKKALSGGQTETRGLVFRSSRIWSQKRLPPPDFEKWCKRLSNLLAPPPPPGFSGIEDKLIKTEQIVEYPKKQEPVSVILPDLVINVARIIIEINAHPIDDPICKFSDLSLDQDRKNLRTTLAVIDPTSKVNPVQLQLVHSLTPPFWKVEPTSLEVEVIIDPGPNQSNQRATLEKFLESHPPRIILDSGATIQQDILSTPKIQDQRFDPNDIVAKGWKDTDITRETDDPRTGYRYNVMEKTVKVIRFQYQLRDSDLLICDDRAHEVADLVLIQVGIKSLTFFHLKYKASSGEDPGLDRKDVDELVGQGVRTGHWIRSPRLMARLLERVTSRSKSKSKVLRGTPAQLGTLAKGFRPDDWTYRVVIVQPGLSKKKLTHAPDPSQAEQLLLMLRDRIIADYGASFSVWVSK